MSDLFSQIVQALSRFTLSSALDILIVTILFYGTLMLVRGTRADQVLRGVILLFIFFSIMAALFHLTMVDWLLRNSPIVLLVAIPIIFQPEIRRALEHVGRTSALINHPLGTLSSPLQPSTVEEIVDAVQRLAERRYGGLLVLEGTTGLEDFVRSGVRVDGEVTSDLLVTIFFVHSPLHDGAVIIRNDRILAAGCVLPLSDNPAALGRGTRHRAAVGITEQTDAACIVVSEESGQISLARAGHLSSDISIERLTRFLEAFYHAHAYSSHNELVASGGG
ncbi:MAG TPA: diadenylate cyclase CdaA [Chloroflexota bacterium]|nr:diadenylate cyclase CdaA [Chloroflexota bacterium]